MKQTEKLQGPKKSTIHPCDISIYDPRGKLNGTKGKIINDIMDLLNNGSIIPTHHASIITLGNKVLTILKDPESIGTINYNDGKQTYSIDSNKIS